MFVLIEVICPLHFVRHEEANLFIMILGVEGSKLVSKVQRPCPSELVFMPHFLNIVVEFMTLVSRNDIQLVFLWVGKGVLPVNNFYFNKSSFSIS